MQLPQDIAAPTPDAALVSSLSHEMQYRMQWSIKASLLDYLSALDDVVVDCRNGASGSLEAGFSFPFVDSRWSGPGHAGYLRSRSEVVLKGHGLTICEIINPEIQFEAESATILVQRWRARPGMLPLAEFTPSAFNPSQGGWKWSSPLLLESGREVFGYQYDVDTPLAVLRVRPPQTMGRTLHVTR